ncbi:MAG: Gfo/Idh/MocA family oxidoreductase [Spirochaetales bacterium]|nr:Gfo/Idh/MocA family oxidoreductase [Spirochaetales bacterium]
MSDTVGTDETAGSGESKGMSAPGQRGGQQQRGIQRKLRLALVGGGPGSFIGGTHRMAARMDDRYETVCGILSSDPARAVEAGSAMGFAPDRRYDTFGTMLESERRRPDKAEVLAIMTPNDSHYAHAMAALEAGMHVICDKPMTTTLEEAKTLHRAVIASGKVFCLTHNYTGYPLVRQSRAMIAAGTLGELRMVQVEYVQGGRAVARPLDAAAPRSWKYDPARSGPSLVMGDIGTHAHNILRYVTGLDVARVSAKVGRVVPGQLVDDYASALLELDNGVSGLFLATQAAAGKENGLHLRVCGALGTLEWTHDDPNRLHFYTLDGPMQVYTPNGPGMLPLAARASRIVKGHPEGFPGAFANLYTDAADAIVARMGGTEPDPLASTFPTSLDGLRGLEFVQAVIDSSRADGAWVVPERYSS